MSQSQRRIQDTQNKHRERAHTHCQIECVDIESATVEGRHYLTVKEFNENATYVLHPILLTLRWSDMTYDMLLNKTIPHFVKGTHSLEPLA